MATQNTDIYQTDEVPSGKDRRFGIVVANWNRDITDRLLEGCIAKLKEHDASEDQIEVSRVPGSFELPLGARVLAGKAKFDAIICIGCIIKGETKHDEYIANAVASGIMQLGLMANLPVVFGVLTPNDHAQASARAGGHLGNKGEEAAVTALVMAELRKKTGSAGYKIGFQ